MTAIEVDLAVVRHDKNGLVLHEHWEVRVPNWGAFSAPTVRSAHHRMADLCVA
ncbi:hypothetical protein [Streptomyces sp. uw30]|uniref:hypothetical protein n=1 Tax=Streptomyces sp. uw30 TaxID=1828179 RepID=UPI001650E8A4|nr:hypothetical protein [Streptomyces sp. uw30]